MRTHIESLTVSSGVPRFTFHVSRFTHHARRWLAVLGGILLASQLQIATAEEQAPQTGFAAVTVQAGGGGGQVAVHSTGANASAVAVGTTEPLAEDDPPAQRTRAWLGVGVEEASEALASQLKLAPGVGLVVTYVTPDSPAAKAGLEENDVLVEFEGQPLVVPAQLRKLVQVRKEGDKVELGFYRGGKKQTVSVTLGKAPPGYGLLQDGETLKDDLGQFYRKFQAWPLGEAWRDALNAYRDQMGNFKFDQAKVQEEVRRSLEQARKAMHDALRYSTNAASEAAAKALREFQRRYGPGTMPETSSSVTVRSSGDRARSIVKADESGTIVIVSNPKPHLTAHDKEGKLLFDGEIATPEQRAKVPPELWEKVEPLLGKLAPRAEEGPAGRLGPLPPLPPRPGMRPLPPPGGPPPTI